MKKYTGNEIIQEAMNEPTARSDPALFEFWRQGFSTIAKRHGHTMDDRVWVEHDKAWAIELGESNDDRYDRAMKGL